MFRKLKKWFSNLKKEKKQWFIFVVGFILFTIFFFSYIFLRDMILHKQICSENIKYNSSNKTYFINLKKQDVFSFSSKKVEEKVIKFPNQDEVLEACLNQTTFEYSEYGKHSFYLKKNIKTSFASNPLNTISGIAISIEDVQLEMEQNSALKSKLDTEISNLENMSF